MTPDMGYRPGRGQVFARLGGLALVAALLCLPAAPAAAQTASTVACRAVEREGLPYTVCVVDPRHADLRLVWADAAGLPYGSFRAVREAVEAKGGRLAMAMNAGMFGEAQEPVGLYVENAIRHRAISTRDGPGNFHLKPNGVFYFGHGEAGVLDTERYLARRLSPEFATQSGPMLVIDGRVHPRFLADSTSRKLRNGVGVTADGLSVFAISDRPVTFMEFALLFRDTLGCPNALFLDGSLSRLYAPSIDRLQAGGPFGPMIAVVE